MITGRFEVVGIRKFKELPKGALFVENILCVWKDDWVGEGLLVYGAENGRETPLLRKVKHGEYGQDSIVERLDGGEEEEGRFWVGPRDWVTWLKRAEDVRRVWMKTKVSVHVTTFGQLHEGEAFIRVGGCGSLEGYSPHSPSTPHVYRRRGELAVNLDGDNERELSLLERVIPVYVGDIRSPEYVVIRARRDGPAGRPFPGKRDEAEDHPEHYEILEGGFPDRASAAERILSAR